ncbi:13080_t:CDS:2 [Funneliformis geosporum]|nr:13080_t:CDS:2 [Funneliformis geosporum]
MKSFLEYFDGNKKWKLSPINLLYIPRRKFFDRKEENRLDPTKK